uniref:Maelstrom domain-containing protein n=1 Tax=Anopheles atroparvus TaxID=41427 RepID=A0A182IIY3_ANOAO
MPKKKQQANPFLMFMLELRSREEAKGRKFRGMEELKDFAGPLWEKMNAQMRAPYVAQASSARQEARETTDKLTGVGLPYSKVEVEKRELEAKTTLIRNRISAMINEAVKNNELDKLQVFFIAFEHFCELSDGRIIPAEMAAIRYSLGAGVIDRIHTLIDPVSLPVGYALAAQEQSEMYHKLPTPPNALGEKDYERIAFQLLEFLSKNGADTPLLFTNSHELLKVETMLHDIVEETFPDLKLLVCPLSEFFYQLKKSTAQFFGGDDQNLPTIHMLQILIDKDVYDFTPDISCEFHEQLGNGKHCALSRCVRWAYVISDTCCIDLSIALEPGKHCPKEADYEVEQLTSGLNTISFISTIGGAGDANAPSTSFASIFANGKPVIAQSGGPVSTAADERNENPWSRPVQSGGRGTRLMLDASREAIRQGGQVAGRGKKLGLDDFPPLGSSRHTFK